MNNSDIFEIICSLKPVLKKEGITLLGIFGSYGRGDYTADSDVDILYDIDNPKAFAQNNGGFAAFSKLESLKEMISQKIGKKIDFVAKRGLNTISKKYVMQDFVRV